MEVFYEQQILFAAVRLRLPDWAQCGSVGTKRADCKRNPRISRSANGNLSLAGANGSAGGGAATSTFAGKFVFNFTITISSTISTSVKIACAANATLEDLAPANVILESAEVTATRSSSTAACTVNIPYSWKLGSAPADKVTLTYQIAAPVEATGTSLLPSRVSEQTVGIISVPANGTTTTETITATI